MRVAPSLIDTLVVVNLTRSTGRRSRGFGEQGIGIRPLLLAGPARSFVLEGSPRVSTPSGAPFVASVSTRHPASGRQRGDPLREGVTDVGPGVDGPPHHRPEDGSIYPSGRWALGQSGKGFPGGLALHHSAGNPTGSSTGTLPSSSATPAEAADPTTSEEGAGRSLRHPVSPYLSSSCSAGFASTRPAQEFPGGPGDRPSPVTVRPALLSSQLGVAHADDVAAGCMASAGHVADGPIYLPLPSQGVSSPTLGKGVLPSSAAAVFGSIGSSADPEEIQQRLGDIRLKVRITRWETFQA